jgi:hypothetical protein
MEGKTIERFTTYDCYLCLFFTDGTYQLLKASHGEYDSEIELVDKGEERLGKCEKHQLGLMSHEEYNKLKQEEETREKIRHQEYERRQYLALKAKYEQ